MHETSTNENREYRTTIKNKNWQYMKDSSAMYYERKIGNKRYINYVQYMDTCTRVVQKVLVLIEKGWHNPDSFSLFFNIVPPTTSIHLVQ